MRKGYHTGLPRYAVHLEFGEDWTLVRAQLAFLCFVVRKRAFAVQELHLTRISKSRADALRADIPTQLQDAGLIVQCEKRDLAGLTGIRKGRTYWKLKDESWRDAKESPLQEWMDRMNERYPLPLFLP